LIPNKSYPRDLQNGFRPDKNRGKIKRDNCIPELLDIVELKGCIVTIDAMGYEKAIAGKIVEKEADYVLNLKGTRGTFMMT
jgi:predicted transposase YbfD/YdcC